MLRAILRDHSVRPLLSAIERLVLVFEVQDAVPDLKGVLVRSRACGL